MNTASVSSSGDVTIRDGTVMGPLCMDTTVLSAFAFSPDGKHMTATSYNTVFFQSGYSVMQLLDRPYKASCLWVVLPFSRPTENTEDVYRLSGSQWNTCI